MRLPKVSQAAVDWFDNTVESDDGSLLDEMLIVMLEENPILVETIRCTAKAHPDSTDDIILSSVATYFLLKKQIELSRKNEQN